MNNKILLKIAVSMLPIVVISFAFKAPETNFNLEKIEDNGGKITKEEKEEINYTIKVKVDEEIETFSLDDYIIGVVAGEMPASFEVEALKAQAVASRTYALYKKNKNTGNEFDLTDDVSSQVYITVDDMKNKWGSEFQKYYDRVKDAVMSTSNEVITYNDEIIESFYFSMSSGNTQEAQYVFNEGRDYLKSVESIYDNSSLNSYEVTQEFTLSEFKEKLGLTCDHPVVGGIDRNESGYVNSITICSKEIKGTNFRFSLGLRSTNFDLNIGDGVSITTRGYGHGVGMSQYGANGYASVGYTYEDIIKHYYTGVEISNLKDV